MKPIAGVVGYGSIGQRHARLLRAIDEVDVLVSDPAVPDSLSFEELLTRRPCAVIVASPDRHHIPQSIASLDADAAVLVEKPICQASAEAEALARHPRASRVLVGYVLRYSALFRRTKDLVAAGRLGQVASFQAILGAYDTLVAAKNRFADGGRDALFFDYSHEWDYISWLLGPVTEVVAAAHQSGGRPLTQNPNVVDAVLRLSGGVTGTVHLDYVQSGGCRRFSLIGDRAALDGDAVAGTLRLRTYGASDELLDLNEEWDAMFIRQLRHLSDVASGAAAPLVTVEDGIRSVRVAEALIRSVRSGGWERP